MCSAVSPLLKGPPSLPTRASSLNDVLTDSPVSESGNLCISSRRRFRELVSETLASIERHEVAPEKVNQLAVSSNLTASSSIAIFAPDEFPRFARMAIRSGDRSFVREVLLASGNHISQLEQSGALTAILWKLRPDVNDPISIDQFNTTISIFLVNSSQALLHSQACEMIPRLLKLCETAAGSPLTELRVRWKSILEDGTTGIPTTILERKNTDILGPSTMRRIPAMLWYMGKSREELPKHGVCLDVGCGREARAACQIGMWQPRLTVRAVDPIFATVTPTDRVPPNVALISEKAEKLPAENGEVALLTAMYSLPFWSRTYGAALQFLREIERVVAPDGQAWIAPFRSNFHGTPHVNDLGLFRRFEEDVAAIFDKRRWDVKFSSGCDGFEWRDPTRFRVLELTRTG